MSDLVLPSSDHSNCGIYSITFENGKRYIGQSRDLARRIYHHENYAGRDVVCRQSALYHAMRKHRYTFEILCNCPEESLNAIEQELISTLNTMVPNGYNLKTGGEASRHSEETKEKIRQAHLGKKKSPEHVAKLKARVISPEARAKMSAAKKGRKLTPEWIAKGVAARIGQKRSEEFKAAQAERGRGRKLSEEAKEKIRQKRLGTRMSAEARAKMSAASKGRPKSEETKQRMRDAWALRKEQQHG